MSPWSFFQQNHLRWWARQIGLYLTFAVMAASFGKFASWEISRYRIRLGLESFLASTYVDQMPFEVVTFARMVYAMTHAATLKPGHQTDSNLSLVICSETSAITSVPAWVESEILSCRPLQSSGWDSVRYETPLRLFSPPLKLRLHLKLDWRDPVRLLVTFTTFVILSILALWVQHIQLEKDQLRGVISRIENALGLGSTSSPNSKWKWKWRASTGSLFEREIRRIQGELAAAKEEQIQLRTRSALGELAAEVAHDIRSPITALNLMAHRIPWKADKDLIMFRRCLSRIDEIAETLLSRYRLQNEEIPQAPGLRLGPRDPQPLVPAIEEILNEKRLAWQIHPGVRMNFVSPAPESASRLRALIDLASFKRALSNLLNNAQEALLKNQGEVLLSLEATETLLTLKVRDFGRGIPSALLPTLGMPGRSFGKSTGTGLGLHQARVAALAWGGSLQLESWTEDSSTERRGTCVTLTIPLSTLSTDSDSTLAGDQPAEAVSSPAL